MISVKSYAKINLVLNVTGSREDGYHNLDSIVLPLALHDSILISKLKNGHENFVTIDDFSSGVVQFNLVTVALQHLNQKHSLNDKLRVFIHKVIPMQAGLGGGSSNAAFTLKAVNKFCGLDASKDELMEISKEIGSDVAFFIDCVPCRMQGTGSVLTPITVKNNYSVIIVKPSTGLKTKEVFDHCNDFDLPVYDIDGAIKALEEGDDDKLAKCVGNALAVPATDLLPEINEIINKLKAYDLPIVQMTGTGSAVFAISNNIKLLKRIEKELEEKYQVIITKVLK